MIKQTVFSSYTEVTTSFMKRGLTRNSVQVAKLTITVQYLKENKINPHCSNGTKSPCQKYVVYNKISNKLPTLKLYK